MDPATLLGLALAFGSLYAMISMEGASINAILLPAPMVLVFGATIAVGMAGTTLKDVLRSFQALPRIFTAKTGKPEGTIGQIVDLAEKARREGLLSMEEEAVNAKDPFMAKALQNVADGTDAEDLRQMLEDEIATKTRTDQTAAKFFKALGGYAPTIGIIGTVVSLTHVLEKLSEPEHLGPMIATAFVATLWGLLSANFIWLPIGAKLSRLVELEAQHMTLCMEGVLAIQEGNQPLLLGERLRALVPAHQLKGQDKKLKDAA